MGCVNLLKGLDLGCLDFTRKYYQQVVLINRNDVDEVLIKSDDNSHRISFNLKVGKSGKLFRGLETGGAYTARFNKTKEKGIPLYQHEVEVPVVGVTENIKTLIKQLDNSDLFAAIQFKDETVEIYGFKNGLTTNDYEYEPQSEIGGAVVPFVSRFEELEPPYVYYAAGLENQHFNNLFADIGAVLGGDFNSDFSNDFHNIEV